MDAEAPTGTRPMTDPWPPGMERVPDEGWVKGAPGERARSYDAVGDHGWYANLDPTVEAVLERVEAGDVIVDYSAGTGLLADRLLQRGLPEGVGVLGVDASPSFLRLAVDKHGDHPAAAFRRLEPGEGGDRLQRLDEALPDPLVGAVDGLVSANAVHLYRGLPETVEGWARALAPGAWAHVQSGNVGPPEALDEGVWLLDETVDALAEAAEDVVRQDPTLARYREALDDPAGMEAHRRLRRRFFPPLRPLEAYTSVLEEGGLAVEEVTRRRIPVDLGEWEAFLATYADGFLGWIGGVERVEGEAPSEEALRDRRRVLARAADRVFDGETFEACWTYVEARRPR